MRFSEPSPLDICFCGHPRSDHVEHDFEGRMQEHCQTCNPMTRRDTSKLSDLFQTPRELAEVLDAHHPFKIDPDKQIK